MSTLNVRVSTPSFGKKTRLLNQAVSGTGCGVLNIVTRPAPGTPTRRSAVAWSAHGSALISYPYTPAAGTWRAVSANRPVSLSFVGNGGRGFAASGFGSKAYRP